MEKVRGLKLVLVEWVDSQASAEWTDWDEIEEDKTPLRCYSVGWIRYSNKENLTIVPNIAVNGREPEQGFGVMTIPVCAIIKVTDL